MSSSSSTAPTSVTQVFNLTNKPIAGQTSVVIHPLVLLSVVDHFNRTACKTTKNRAVGVLLGSWKKGNVLDVANSFAVPFEEDAKNPDVWFLDHDYLGSMFAMFRKVNARERVVGWYHTGPKLRANDIQINELIRRYVSHPVLVVIDAQPKELGLPTRAYVAVEEVHDDGSPAEKTFEYLSSEIGAEEAEEVGVEHLLRDIKDIGESGTISHKLQHQLSSLKGLYSHLAEVKDYLDLVAKGSIPINHQIVYALQDAFNLLPNLDLPEFVRSLSVKTSDSLLVVYLSSVLRATIALHHLITNKVELRQAEKKDEQQEKKKEEKEDEKDKAKDGDKKEEGEKKEGDSKTETAKKA